MERFFAADIVFPTVIIFEFCCLVGLVCERPITFLPISKLTLELGKGRRAGNNHIISCAGKLHSREEGKKKVLLFFDMWLFHLLNSFQSLTFGRRKFTIIVLRWRQLRLLTSVRRLRRAEPRWRLLHRRLLGPERRSPHLRETLA